MSEAVARTTWSRAVVLVALVLPMAGLAVVTRASRAAEPTACESTPTTCCNCPSIKKPNCETTSGPGHYECTTSQCWNDGCQV